MSRVEADLARELDVAEEKAWDALSRYKFMMFGYWAAIWVHQNRVGHFKCRNPFASLVEMARGRRHETKRPAPAAPLLDGMDDAA